MTTLKTGRGILAAASTSISPASQALNFTQTPMNFHLLGIIHHCTFTQRWLNQPNTITWYKSPFLGLLHRLGQILIVTIKS